MTEALHNILLIVKKPVETFNELKYRRYRHWGLIALTLAAWLIVDIMVKQLYGFRFNTNHADELNILIELSMTIEDEFGLGEISEDDLKTIKTIGDLVDYVEGATA